MRTIDFSTEHAHYRIHLNVVDEDKPYTVFLHGGPGLNTFAERGVLGQYFHSRVNFIWFDLIGCGETKGEPDQVTWRNQIADVILIVEKFSRGNSVHFIAHCFATHITHSIVRARPDLVRSVTFYSPARNISDAFKGLVQRSLDGGLLTQEALTESEKSRLKVFFEKSEKEFGLEEVLFLLSIVPKITAFQTLYWKNHAAMEQYFRLVENHPMSIETLVKIQTDFFSQNDGKIPDYSGIPVLILRSNEDGIVPWELHGAHVAKAIPHAEIKVLQDGFHWLQFEKPQECAEATLSFLLAYS